jgi:hypothetical protein
MNFGTGGLHRPFVQSVTPRSMVLAASTLTSPTGMSDICLTHNLMNKFHHVADSNSTLRRWHTDRYKCLNTLYKH